MVMLELGLKILYKFQCSGEIFVSIFNLKLFFLNGLEIATKGYVTHRS